MQSKAKSAAEYLAELPPDRREAIRAVRDVILKNLGEGFAEGMQYGMICYSVPHSVYPPGYHCDPRQPLPFVGLASQKGYMSLYLSFVYGSPKEEAAFRARWARSGKKLDMGKSCIRFKRTEDLCLDLIGEYIAGFTAASYISRYEASLAASKRPAGSAKPARATRSAPKKKAGAKPSARKAPARASGVNKSPRKATTRKASARRT